MSKRKYRKFRPELKLQVVLDVVKGNKSQAEIVREYDIHPQLIDSWKQDFFKKASSVFEDKREKDNKEKKIEELESIIGRQTVELQFLKKALNHLN